MKEITIYEFQLREIVEALRVTSNIHKCSSLTTCHDRMVTQAYQFAKNALDGNKDLIVRYGIKSDPPRHE